MHSGSLANRCCCVLLPLHSTVFCVCILHVNIACACKGAQACGQGGARRAAGEWRVVVLARKTLSGFGFAQRTEAERGGAAGRRAWRQCSAQEGGRRHAVPGRKNGPGRRSDAELVCCSCTMPSCLLGCLLLEEGNQVGSIVRLLQPSKHHLGACGREGLGGREGGRVRRRRQESMSAPAGRGRAS